MSGITENLPFLSELCTEGVLRVDFTKDRFGLILAEVQLERYQVVYDRGSVRQLAREFEMLADKMNHIMEDPDLYTTPEGY